MGQLLRDCRLNCEGSDRLVVRGRHAHCREVAATRRRICDADNRLFRRRVAVVGAPPRVPGQRSHRPQLFGPSIDHTIVPALACCSGTSSIQSEKSQACHDGELIAGDLSSGRRTERNMTASLLGLIKACGEAAERPELAALRSPMMLPRPGPAGQSMPASQKLAARPSASVPLLWAVRTTAATRPGVPAPQPRTESAQNKQSPGKAAKPRAGRGHLDRLRQKLNDARNRLHRSLI
jgi:hypothetical protein